MSFEVSGSRSRENERYEARFFPFEDEMKKYMRNAAYLYSLRINSQYRGSPIYIPEYDQFAVDNDRQNYKLQILYFLSNISTVCDSLSSSWDNTNGILFSTYDHDYDSYALNYHGT
ncbi:unnamed protein product [Rotaria sp. Silwood2]|nr:unnamed protein product [Rotaria sp. Silwood2]